MVSWWTPTSAPDVPNNHLRWASKNEFEMIVFEAGDIQLAKVAEQWRPLVT